jgi:hypothetical protein
VAGHGRMDSHAAVAGEKADEEIACVACDYGYFASKDDEDKQGLGNKYAPILVTRDENASAVFGDMVRQKGNDPYAMKVLADYIVYLGHPL